MDVRKWAKECGAEFVSIEEARKLDWSAPNEEHSRDLVSEASTSEGNPNGTSDEKSTDFTNDRAP